MSQEQKKERTVDDIRIEYTQLCSKVGHIRYQIALLEKDLNVLFESMATLNVEASKLSEAKKESN